MLQDNKTYVTKRGRSCVIRYFLKYVNEEEHYRALLILFYPFRNEMKEIHNRNVKDLYCSNMSVIEENRAKYEKHKVLLECAAMHVCAHSGRMSVHGKLVHMSIGVLRIFGGYLIPV